MLTTGLKRNRPVPPAKKTVIERIASYRDVGVLIAGLAYSLGYASRALHAFDFNLGTLPGARFEYLVAGALLLIPPAALWLILWFVWLQAKRLAAWAAKERKRKTQVSNALAGATLLGLILFPFVGKGAFANVVLVFFLCTFGFSLLYYANTGDDSHPSSAAERDTARTVGWRRVMSLLGRAALRLWGAAIVLNFAVLLLMLFLGAVLFGAIALPHIPQEFGGVKPKCGVLDLVPEKLSPEIRSLLIDSKAIVDPISKVIRSKPVEVYAANDPWLIRVPGTPPRQNSCRSDMILNLGAIRMKDGTVRRSIQEQDGGAVTAAGERQCWRGGERNWSVSADIGTMA